MGITLLPLTDAAKRELAEWDFPQGTKDRLIQEASAQADRKGAKSVSGAIMRATCEKETYGSR